MCFLQVVQSYIVLCFLSHISQERLAVILIGEKDRNLKNSSGVGVLIVVISTGVILPRKVSISLFRFRFGLLLLLGFMY